MNIISKYGFMGSLKLFINLINTKLFYNKCRIIRSPFDIRNRRYIDLGEGLTTGTGCRIEAFPKDKNAGLCIEFGKNVQINDYVHIAAGESVKIGNNVLMASKIFISDINHGSYDGKKADLPDTIAVKREISTAPVVIKDNVWIGESVCILPGVTIGKNSVIGALSLVSKNIPDNSIAVGNPARVIKKFDFEKKQWVRV